MGATWAKFSGPPCESCGWGPSNRIAVMLNDYLEVDFGRLCIDCRKILENLGSTINRQDHDDPVAIMLHRLKLRGFRFTTTQHEGPTTTPLA